MSMFKSPKAWAYGLASGVIGGTSTAVVSWLGTNVAQAAGMDVPSLNFKALGIIMASSGIFNAFLYLSKSPLPPLANGNGNGNGNTDIIKKPE